MATRLIDLDEDGAESIVDLDGGAPPPPGAAAPDVLADERATADHEYEDTPGVRVLSTHPLTKAQRIEAMTTGAVAGVPGVRLARGGYRPPRQPSAPRANAEAMEPPAPEFSRSAGARFAGGATEGSTTLDTLRQALMDPGGTLKGLGEAAKSAGGDPIQFAAQGLMGELRDGFGRAGEQFEQIGAGDESTRRGQALQTLMAFIPGVGRVVAPIERSIPADERQPVDVARVAGAATGPLIDAAAGMAAGRLGGAAVGAATRRATRRLPGEMNAALGTTAKSYAGGRNPVRGALDEGLTPSTPPAEATRRLTSALDRETANKAKLVSDADASGVVAATGPDIGQAVSKAFNERLKLDVDTYGADSVQTKRFQRVQDRLLSKASAQSTWKPSELQGLIKQVDRMMKPLSRKSPIRDALNEFRKDLDGMFDRSVRGMDEVNTNIRNRQSARDAARAKALKDQAAGVPPGLTGDDLIRLLLRAGLGGGAAAAGAKLVYDRFSE